MMFQKVQLEIGGKSIVYKCCTSDVMVAITGPNPVAEIRVGVRLSPCALKTIYRDW